MGLKLFDILAVLGVDAGEVASAAASGVKAVV